MASKGAAGVQLQQGVVVQLLLLEADVVISIIPFFPAAVRVVAGILLVVPPASLAAYAAALQFGVPVDIGQLHVHLRF